MTSSIQHMVAVCTFAAAVVTVGVPALAQAPREALRAAESAIQADDFQQARAALTELAGGADATDAQKLEARFLMAGTHGAAGDMDAMREQMQQVEAQSDLPVAAIVTAQNSAARLLTRTKDYLAAQVLAERADALRREARAVRRYAPRFFEDVPAGAGGWARWDFATNAENREALFENYMGADAEVLIADITTERPQIDDTQAEGHIDTSFAMAYDERGWHIYVRSQEPNVQQIMANGGQGGSMLEMFFTPGLDGEAYYQWIINQATGELDIFHWSSPHREYRLLEDSPWSFQTNTVTLDDGWGTLITIPWEAVYDKLPFNEGESTWRFSLIRWSPQSNVTWGGRVHEMGRWGRIEFEPPTAAQRAEIQRHVVRRAWSRYRTAASSLTTHWTGPQGDDAFYREQVQPLIDQHDAFSDQMETVGEWDAQTLADVFEQHVPQWMELTYEVEARRHTYLSERLFDGE